MKLSLVGAVMVTVAAQSEAFQPAVPLQQSMGRSSGSNRSCRGRVRAAPSMMFGGWGAKTKKADADSVGSKGGRPTAGAAKKGTVKTVMKQQESWGGPAKQRKEQAKVEQAKRNSGRQLKGVFTPSQMEQFELARKEVTSGSGDKYWNAIAAKVDGQSAATCKRMAESQLFEKAVGTQAGFFKSYIEVQEVEARVSNDEAALTKLKGLFGGGKK